MHIKLETEMKLSWYAGGGIGCDTGAEKILGRLFNLVFLGPKAIRLERLEIATRTGILALGKSMA